MDYTKRPCLRCQREFKSAGSHNRICKKCKKRANEKVLIPNRFRAQNTPIRR